MIIRPVNKQGYLLQIAIPLLIFLGLFIYWTGYNLGFAHDDPLSNSTDETLIYQESFTMYANANSSAQRGLQGYPPAILWLLRAAQLFTPQPKQPQPVEAVAYIRLLNGIFNVCTLIVLILIGRRLYSDLAGVIAACAWLFAPLIVTRVDVALTEPGQALFVALALYFAICAIDGSSARAALISVLVALVAVLFKYSAFSALGLGVGAVLWHWHENRWKWSLVLMLQAACIALVAFLLLSVYGAGALSDNPEGAAFLRGSMLQFSLFSHAFGAGAQQIGWGVLPLLIAYAAGTILYLRAHGQQRRYIWAMMSLYVLAYLIIMLTYIVFWHGAQRYLATITPVLVLLMSISLVQLATFAVQRIKIESKLWQSAVVVVCAAIWIAPLAGQTLAELRQRSQPNPVDKSIKAMVDWSARALPEGTIRIPDRSNLWSFFDTWWGYVGPQRPWVYAGITQHTLDEWRSIYVRYLYVSDDERAQLLATEAGSQYLDNLLPLRHFPIQKAASGATNPTGFSIYSIDSIANRVDQTFDGQITLLGYNMSGSFQIQPYWQVTAHPEKDFQVFVHLVPLNGTDLVAQDDGTPAQPSYPTSAWDTPGEVVIGQTRNVQIPATLPAGQYRLLLGLYDLQTGTRLKTENDSDFVLIATVNFP